MRPHPQGRTQHNLIENRRRSIDDELTALCRLYDSAQVARIHFRDWDRTSFAQETPRARWVAVPAPHRMSLALQQLCEKGAGRSGTQDEDPHGVVKTLSHSTYPFWTQPGPRSLDCTVSA